MSEPGAVVWFSLEKSSRRHFSQQTGQCSAQVSLEDVGPEWFNSLGVINAVVVSSSSVDVVPLDMMGDIQVGVAGGGGVRAGKVLLRAQQFKMFNGLMVEYCSY